MKGKKTRTITLLILIAFALIVGCSHETPTPANKNNTTQNSNPQNNKPSTEENKDNAPSTGTDKEETVITVPEWAKDRSYRNHKGILHFNELGIPNLPVTGDISIIEATENKLVITAGTKTVTITRNEDGTLTKDDDKLYPDVDGPEWLKGKAFQGMVDLEFNSRGILSNELIGHKLSHISNITENSVTYVIVSDDEAKTGNLIVSKNADPLLIDVEIEGHKMKLQIADKN